MYIYIYITANERQRVQDDMAKISLKKYENASRHERWCLNDKHS